MIKILNPLVQIDHNILGPLKIMKYESCFLFVSSGVQARSLHAYMEARAEILKLTLKAERNILSQEMEICLIINSPPSLIPTFYYKNEHLIVFFFIGYQIQCFFDSHHCIGENLFIDLFCALHFERDLNQKFKVYAKCTEIILDHYTEIGVYIKKMKSYRHNQKLMYPPENYKHMI